MSPFAHTILNSICPSGIYVPASCIALSLEECICRGLPSKPRFLAETAMPQYIYIFTYFINSLDATHRSISTFYHFKPYKNQNACQSSVICSRPLTSTCHVQSPPIKCTAASPASAEAPNHSAERFHSGPEYLERQTRMKDFPNNSLKSLYSTT